MKQKRKTYMLTLDHDDPEKELEFEVAFQLTLTEKQRYAMMKKLAKQVGRLCEKMSIKKLLQLLVAHKVKFVVIGAWAFPSHGYSRSTYDIDFFYEPTQANISRLVDALQKAGYVGVKDLTMKQLKEKKTLFRQYAQLTDIHPFVAGAKFKEVWKNKKTTKIENVEVFVPSLEHLIKMKKAAGRTKDLADLEFLEEIQKQKTWKKVQI